jgi:hypothetical protein
MITRPYWTAALLAIALAAPAAGAEQQPASQQKSIVTDRPTDGAAPELVPRLTLQLEMGYKFSRLDDNSGRRDTQVIPDFLARFGISDRIEARLTAAGWNFTSGTAGNKDGFTDVSLGTKIALTGEQGLRPQMALLADVSVPVGKAGFTDDYVIPKVLFLAAHTLTDRLALTYNVGPSIVTAKEDNGTRTDVNLNYAAALSGPVRGPIGLFGEIYGALAFGRDRSDSHSFQAGATVLLHRVFQIDFRGGFGLVDSEPDWLVGAGLAFRLPH